MSDTPCTCPKGRPLSMPHLTGCPIKDADDQPNNVTVLRGADGRPVSVPEDVVQGVDRAYRAWQLKLEGETWEDIADAEGWPNGAAAAAEVRRYLDEGRAALSGFKQREIKALWEGRLENLYRYALPAAKDGKVPSLMACLAVARQAMVLHQLDKPSEDDLNVATVVVPSHEYIASLKKQSEAS